MNFDLVAEKPRLGAYKSPVDEENEDYPGWDWRRGPPPPKDVDVEPGTFSKFAFMSGKPFHPIHSPDVENPLAPWASAPDDDDEEGAGPRPLSIPEDNDEPDEEKDVPKGTVVPIWLCIPLVAAVSYLGASSVAAPPGGYPPALGFNPAAPTSNALPSLPIPDAAPCVQSAECGYIMGAIDPALPPKTRDLINIPGTCQNWSREWLRTGKDIMEFQVERIRQRFAMALMYCEFNGDNWLQGDLWVSDLHECDWYTMIGVDPCSRFEEYQIIRNYGQQMRGTLPPEISMLSTLWEITLSDNLLSGTIPTDFIKLSELDTFSLSFNLFKGTIPEFVWQFEDMVYLDLAYNFFTGTIPNNVYLTESSLRTLFLENNDISGSIPSDFGRIDWQRLHLDGNQLTGTIPSDINAPRIEELLLHNNQLTGSFPAADFATNFAGKVSKLRQVTLYNNDLSGDVDAMCDLMSTGNLVTFEVDLGKMACSCCSQGGV